MYATQHPKEFLTTQNATYVPSPGATLVFQQKGKIIFSYFIKPMSCWTRICFAFEKQCRSRRSQLILDLHCLSFSIWIYINNLESDWLTIINRRGIVIYSAWQSLNDSRRHSEFYRRICESSEDLDQPAHSLSLVRSSLGSFWIVKYTKFLHADNGDWSDCPGRQTDKSLRWAYMSEGTFPHVSAHFIIWCKFGKKALMSYAKSEGPDKHAHPCSVILAFSVRRHVLQYLLILKADNKGPNQPAHSRRLIWACVVRKLHNGPFLALRIIGENRNRKESLSHMRTTHADSCRRTRVTPYAVPIGYMTFVQWRINVNARLLAHDVYTTSH